MFDTLEQVVRQCLKRMPRSTGKLEASWLRPAIADSLETHGFEADCDDKGHFLMPGMPTWRCKADGKLVETKGRRKINLVVKLHGQTVGLIEVESDLDNLQAAGTRPHRDSYNVLGSGPIDFRWLS